MVSADVIVVGGGYNGLACAAYLVKTGGRVVVLKGQGVLGGLSAMEEMVANVSVLMSSATVRTVAVAPRRDRRD